MGDTFEKHILKKLKEESASALKYGENEDTMDHKHGTHKPLMEAAINWRTCACKLQQQINGRIEMEVEGRNKRQREFEITKERLAKEEEESRLRLNEMVEEQAAIEEDYKRARKCVNDLEKKSEPLKK